MTVTVFVRSFEATITGSEKRPVMFHMGCFMTSDEGHVFEGEWPECMAEVGRWFPGTEFTASWTGSTCTMTPDPAARHFVPDPACPMFWMEA
jgi:hypothetical protein